jgi:Mlc titration factor MtfA (ptsG expression regulator)
MTGSLNRVAHAAVRFAADFDRVTTARRQTEPVSETSPSLAARLWSASPTVARKLDPEARERYVAHAERLTRRVKWEAARGLALTDGVIEVIAAHAALLVAGFEPRTEPFRDVTSVIVHAGTIVTREVTAGPARGVVSDEPRYIAGQAGHGRGPIVLDWRTAEREIPYPEGGTNVIYHEFAHKLDQLDGVFDGMPPLGSDEGRARWMQTMGTNYRRLRRRGQDPLVRAYGATNETEYFAVTTELFFTVPALLREHHKRVYDVLADFYKQDPA